MASRRITWPAWSLPAWPFFRPPQACGRLVFDPARVPSFEAELGDFILRWDSGLGETGPRETGSREAGPEETRLGTGASGRAAVRKACSFTIYHRSQPGKVVWGTPPGQGFVAAGRGIERVAGQGGFFKISDRRVFVCADQTLDRVEAGSNFVRLSGALGGGRGDPSVPYELSWTAVHSRALAFRLEVQGQNINRTFLTGASDPDERFFGFGEQFSFLDMKGRRLPVFVMESGVGRGMQPLTFGANLAARAGGSWHTTYAGVPHYLTSRMRSLYLESSEYSVFDLCQPDRVQIELFSPRMDGRILAGGTPAELVSLYTELTGRMRPLPDWILFGAVVGMQGGTAQVRKVFADLKRHGVPLAAFWLQDWAGQRTTTFGEQLWWNWELDRTRYPGWEELVADLAEEGVRVMVYINPFLVDASAKGNAKRLLYQEAAEKGFLVHKPDGDIYHIEKPSTSSGLVDLTNPAACEWLKAVIRENLIETGSSGWMADYGESLPYDACLASGEPAASFHNRYPVAWARLNREAIAEAGLEETAVFFTRSGYTHSPTFSNLFWTGDQLVSWDAHDGIKTSVTALLSSGLSGFAFNHPDLGGYTSIRHPLKSYVRSQELLLRWMELCAFTVIYRSHEGNRPAENVQVYSSEETLAHFSRFARVYAAWEFYRLELVRQAAITGLPVVRHLMLHYPDDPEVYRLTYQQFMVGSELMIAPVLDPGRQMVRVYLPAGTWVHTWSSRAYGQASRGSFVTVSAPLGRPGVFYPAGSEVGERFRRNLHRAGLLDPPSGSL